MDGHVGSINQQGCAECAKKTTPAATERATRGSDEESGAELVRDVYTDTGNRPTRQFIGLNGLSGCYDVLRLNFHSSKIISESELGNY